MSKVCVLGSGFSGLITAHVLLSDGFDVEIVSQDASPGGVWCRERVYPDLHINSVHGVFHFSCLPMETPKDATATGGRLSGEDMCKYAETFTSKFLSGRIRYNTQVTKMHRDDSGWRLETKDLLTGVDSVLEYSKLVLCTGGCHTPFTPEYLSPKAVETAGFKGPVIHSRDFRLHRSELIASPNGSPRKVVIIGCGKSAQDIARDLAKAGHHPIVVFEKADLALASPHPLPDFMRKSRLLSVLSPHITLDTALERFFHKTRVGSWVVRALFNTITWLSNNALAIPADSPLRNTYSMFWSVRLSDEGVVAPDSFYKLVNEGRIELVAPARATGFAPNGAGVQLADGRTLAADAVVVATGYKSSWNGILDNLREDLGLEMTPEEDESKYADMWKYTTLENPPTSIPATTVAGTVYRGLVPAKTINRRDFAINGAVFSTNNGYTYEIGAHWISSYFLNDRFLKLPTEPKEALEHARMSAAWLRRRYPQVLSWANESYSTGLSFHTWPQVTDDLLSDMHLRTHRSGGGPLWFLRVIRLTQIETIGEERRALRAQYAAQAKKAL